MSFISFWRTIQPRHMNQKPPQIKTIWIQEALLLSVNTTTVFLIATYLFKFFFTELCLCFRSFVWIEFNNVTLSFRCAIWKLQPVFWICPCPQSICAYYWWVCACDLERDCGFFVCFFVPVDMQVGLKAEILMDDDKFMLLLTKKTTKQTFEVLILVFSSSGKLSFSEC